MICSKIFCNDLQPGVRLEIEDRHGTIQKYKILKMIPMQRAVDGHMYPINDIEILLVKKHNIYFSYHMYLNDNSWVKRIKIL